MPKIVLPTSRIHRQDQQFNPANAFRPGDLIQFPPIHRGAEPEWVLVFTVSVISEYGKKSLRNKTLSLTGKYYSSLEYFDGHNLLVNYKAVLYREGKVYFDGHWHSTRTSK